MEKLSNCPICRAEEHAHYLRCQDKVASGEWFDLVQCKQCGFVFTNPRPEQEAIGPYYASKNYLSHADESGSLIHRIYRIVRSYSIRGKINLIRSYKSGGKLLDIGCGLGHFLHVVQKSKYFQTAGADVSEAAIAHCKTKFGLDIYREDELNRLTESFDVITQWHVLEHVHGLDTRMEILKRLLKPDGYLFIALPCRNSFDASYFKADWDAYDVPRHIYHFNQTDVRNLFEKYGFECIREKGLLFDAPYVSSRSFKSGSGIIRLIKGICIGLYSNMKASTSGNYSSIIYILKKKDA